MVVLLIILAILLLIFAVPYGVDVIYAGGKVRLGVKAGPFRVWLLPKKAKKPKTGKALEREQRRQAKKDAKKLARQKAKAAKKAAAEQDQTQTVKAKKPLDVPFLVALLKMGAHAIRRFFRSFTIDRLQLRYTVATRDPYDTAMQYAYLCAGLSALPGIAGDVIHVRRRDVRVDMDFTTEKPTVEGRLTVSLQLFRLVHVAVAFGVEFIGWKLKHRKAEAAGATERKDDNGREQDQRTHGRDDDQDQAAG